MMSQEKFHVIESEQTRIELSDLTLFEFFRDVLEEHAEGSISLLKVDALLYVLYFAEFYDRPITRSFLKEAECIMTTHAYTKEFGFHRLAYILTEIREQLLHDYFVFGSIILTNDGFMVNDKLYLRQMLD